MFCIQESICCFRQSLISNVSIVYEANFLCSFVVCMCKLLALFVLTNLNVYPSDVYMCFVSVEFYRMAELLSF